jgi:expansin
VTRTSLLSPRWLAAGGALTLAAVLGVAMLLQNSGSACAAPPSTSAKKGKATFYELGSAPGNCSFPGAPADDLFVALGDEQYATGAACGTYLDVTGPRGKVRVKVVDRCPECAAGHLDLSRTAFKRIGDEVDGIIPITYRTVPKPSVPAPISVRVKEGSSQFWLAVLIDNHGSRLTSVTVNGRRTHRESFNYWVIDGGAGKGPFRIKITDGYGRSTTLAGIDLSPGTTQKTTVRLSGAGKPAPAASPARKKATPKPSASSTPPQLSAAPLVEATEAAAPVEAPPEPPVDLAAGTAPDCG